MSTVMFCLWNLEHYLGCSYNFQGVDYNPTITSSYLLFVSIVLSLFKKVQNFYTHACTPTKLWKTKYLVFDWSILNKPKVKIKIVKIWLVVGWNSTLSLCDNFEQQFILTFPICFRARLLKEARNCTVDIRKPELFKLELVAVRSSNMSVFRIVIWQFEECI